MNDSGRFGQSSDVLLRGGRRGITQEGHNRRDGWRKREEEGGKGRKKELESGNHLALVQYHYQSRERVRCSAHTHTHTQFVPPLRSVPACVIMPRCVCVGAEDEEQGGGGAAVSLGMLTRSVYICSSSALASTLHPKTKKAKFSGVPSLL